MKLTAGKKQGTFVISDLTSTETDTILAIVDIANRRYFKEQEDSGEWYSNDDFILRLTNEQRKALTKVGEIYNA